MAIQDDFVIDYVDLKITYNTTFVHDRPPNIYTVNELYSWLQDEFDEPEQMDDPVPMSAQTPTQYTIVNKWFMNDNTMKALYGGSIQTSGWTKSGSEGITALRWNTAAGTPDVADIGEILTGGSSTATGVLLDVDGYRSIAWVRNTSAAQFQSNENITGTGVDFDTEDFNGFQSGESIWSNLFSVGSLQTSTEVYIGQEDDYLGGKAYHLDDGYDGYQRRIEKIDEWWDADVDFFTGSPNLLGGAGHFDVLVKTQEASETVDGQRLAVYARTFSKVYSHFELVGGVGNFVVPFSSTGSDLNSQDGPYNALFDGKTGNDLEVGDILENAPHDAGAGLNEPVNRLRAVVTAVTGGAGASGDFDYYLIGENEPWFGPDGYFYERTLVNFIDNDDIQVRGDTTDFDIDGTALFQGPATAQGITVTFGNTQLDIDEDTTDEEYACTINCNNVALAEVYKRMMFLTSRGNQDGTTPDRQDTLIQSAASVNVDTDGSPIFDGYDEPGEFYRAVGDIVFDWDNRQGSAPPEGTFVVNAHLAAWTASGVLVSLSSPSGASGKCVLTQVKGTWADGDRVTNVGQWEVNYVTVNEPTSITSIVDNTAAPFGTFAGGRWFVAQGVVLINVPSSDNNNWQTIDLDGNTIQPPTTITITFAGLEANDRAALFEVDTSGGTDITKNQNGVASGGGVSDTTFELDTSIALDVPEEGWVRVVDTSSTTGQEYRFEYSAISGTTVTFRTHANLSGTDDGTGTTTRIITASAFTSYGTDNNVKTGMMIRETGGGEWAVVLRKVSNNEIETTPLTNSGTWNSAGWEANQVVVALAADDTCYFGFIDDEAIGTSIAKNVKFVESTNLVARARFSDPDVGGQRILPFEQKTITLGNANLTVTAIRTDDTIASVT